jgi:ribosome maturation factor RimP
MIVATQIEEWVRALAEGTDMFVVRATVAPGNRIRVLVDRLSSGLTMKDCVAIHRHIESHLDRETEDFELEVGSPGMEEPFTHPLQYVKNIGRQVRVILIDGTEVSGRINAVIDKAVTIIPEAKSKGKSKAVPTIEVEPVSFDMNQIKETKKIITFK